MGKALILAHTANRVQHPAMTYLDVAVSLLLYRVQRPDLVLAGVPVDMQILLIVCPSKILVHSLYYLLIRSSLERHRFAFIVEAEVYIYGHLYTTPTSIDTGSNDRLGVEGRRLSNKIVDNNVNKADLRADKTKHSHENTLLCIANTSKPSSILWYSDILMSRHTMWFSVYHSDGEWVMSCM